MPKNYASVLTDKAITAAHPLASRQEIPDGGCKGLYLIVQSSGIKSWAARYRLHGKPGKATLGQYPDLKLKDARDAARSVLAAASEGRDPKGMQFGAKANRVQKEETVAAYLDEYCKRDLAKNSAKYALETGQALDREIRPKWGHRPITDIKRKDIIRVLDSLVDAGKPTMANRLHSILRRFFNWLCERDVLEVSPLGNLKAPAVETTRDRVLSRKEMRLLWLAAERQNYPFGALAQLLALTGLRKEEIAGASWPEIKLDDLAPTLTIPKTRMKNKREHVVPLSATAVAIINSLPKFKREDGTLSPFLFTTTGATSISGWGRAKEQLDKAMLDLARQEAEARGEDPEKVTLDAFTYHDIRRSVATRMAEIGVLPHTVEAVLSHVSGTISGVAAVYNRHAYLPEKTEALTRWAAELSNIVADKSNVVPLRKTEA